MPTGLPDSGVGAIGDDNSLNEKRPLDRAVTSCLVQPTRPNDEIVQGEAAWFRSAVWAMGKPGELEGVSRSRSDLDHPFTMTTDQKWDMVLDGANT